MNLAIDLPLESVVENATDHNDLINYFKAMDMPTLEHINTCSGIAIQELNSNVEDLRAYFAEFDSIYGIADEELVIERIEQLQSTTNKANREEAMYLIRWVNKQRKFGLYV